MRLYYRSKLDKNLCTEWLSSEIGAILRLRKQSIGETWTLNPYYNFEFDWRIASFEMDTFCCKKNLYFSVLVLLKLMEQHTVRCQIGKIPIHIR